MKSNCKLFYHQWYVGSTYFYNDNQEIVYRVWADDCDGNKIIILEGPTLCRMKRIVSDHNERAASWGCV